MKRKGISLLETVIAAMILSTVVMTVCGLSAKGLRSVRLNQEYEKAWDYLNRQLVLIDTAGVDVLVQGASTSGQFESFDGRLWQWTAQAQATELTDLYDVVVRLEWISGGQLRHIQCRTRLCGQPTMVEETEQTTETSQTGQTTQ